MHVLVTSDTLGGVWTYTRELVGGLLDRGHSVTLVSLGRLPNRAQTAWAESLPMMDFRPTSFRLEWMQNSESDIERSKDFLELLASEIQPDVMHFNQYCYGELTCRIPRVVVAHSDVLSWWTSVHQLLPEDNSWLRWYREVVTRGLCSADAVIAPSQWMLNAVRTYYVHADCDRVIYNGRSPELFDPYQNKINSVLSVGRIWDDGKQVGLLTAREHGVPVIIAGPERSPDDPSKVAPNSATIRFRGEQTEEELRLLYASSSTYAATSRYEPFGLAPLEAALSRCALVLNDIPVFRELWSDSAIYFRRNDPDGLAEAIEELSQNTKLNAEYAERAFAHACAQFDANRMVNEYEQLYGQLIERGAGA